MSPRAKPKRMGTCADCGEEFEAQPRGAIPKRCADCRGPKAEQLVEEDGPKAEQLVEEEAPAAAEASGYRQDHLLVLAEIAVARGVDPVEALLAAIAAAGTP